MNWRNYIDNVSGLFRQYKDLGDKAISQVRDGELSWKPDPESNSIAVIMQHVGGNLRSRWTDFQTTDGEKPWRERDAEFEDQSASRRQLVEQWEKGWQAVFAALASIDEGTLDKTIRIRGQSLTLIEALNRSVTHTAYHVGQIVLLAKALRSGDWKTLSIAKGKSKEFTP
jgi:hypothetical protein